MWRTVSSSVWTSKTPFPIDLGKLDEEVNVAMYTMQRTEGQRVQVTPASRRSLGNYGKSDPMQYWDVILSSESVNQDCVNVGELWRFAQF